MAFYYSVIELAAAAAQLLSDTLVVVQATNSGSYSRYRDAFPSLSDEQISTLDDDGCVVLRCGRDGYERIVRDLQDEHELIDACVTFINAYGERASYSTSA